MSMLENIRARVEEIRSNIRSRIEQLRGGAGFGGQFGGQILQAPIISEIRKKGIIETVRARTGFKLGMGGQRILSQTVETKSMAVADEAAKKEFSDRLSIEV